MRNRAELFGRLDDRIDMARSSGQLLGLMVLRTQRMRELSLLFGYEAGERAADAMHQVIVDAMRDGDEVVRIGDCDFAILLPGLRNRQHIALAAAKLVRVLQVPLDGGGQPLQLSIAIGAAVCPDDATDADLLCRLADSASDIAARGSDRYALYEHPEFTATFGHGELRDAITNNRLQLYLQPILDLRDGRIDRVESLSRWTHDELGDIPPDAFIRVAEQTGLIGELTRWNLNVALRHIAQARAAGHGLGMSVNVSVHALQQPSLVIQIRDMLRFWNVPADAVVLELTESALMDDLHNGERVLHALRDQGFGVAIDDFGTGYSSMAYLKRLPVTELKIDKTFVIDMTRDPRTDKLVGSMVDLSHQLGIEVVCEGVEDAATLERLRTMGCDHAQGYFVGRPAPADEQIAALRALDGVR